MAGQRGGHVADAQPRRSGVVGVARRVAGHLRLLEHAAGLRQQRPSRIGEQDAALRAVEQLHAELGLELADLLADGGLRDVQALRRAPEVQLLGDSDEVPQVAEFHGRPFGAGKSI